MCSSSSSAWLPLSSSHTAALSADAAASGDGNHATRDAAELAAAKKARAEAAALRVFMVGDWLGLALS